MNGQPLLKERSTAGLETVDRWSQPVDRCGCRKLLKMVQCDFFVAQVGNPGHSHSKNIKGFILGHFHARREPPLNVPLLGIAFFELVSNNLSKPSLEADPSEQRSYDVPREVQEAVFIVLQLRGS